MQGERKSKIRRLRIQSFHIIYNAAANGTAYLYKCTLGISFAPAFVADFPPYAHKFNQRTFHVRLINLCTSDKKSSHKIRHKETPRVHIFINSGKNKSAEWLFTQARTYAVNKSVQDSGMFFIPL